MEQDGRRGELYGLLIQNVGTRPGCSACRPFFKTHAAACKAPKIRLSQRQKKGPAPTPTPYLRQREPHIRVIVLATALFQRIAADERIAEDSAIAIREYVSILLQNDGKSGGAQDYFSTLAAYVEAPFKKLLKSAEKKEQEGSKRPKNWFDDKSAVDALFDN
jgi:hypothetical protein